MYRKRINICLLILVFFGLIGCRSLRLNSTNNKVGKEIISTAKFIEEIRSRNICRNSFHITKMKIKYFDGERNRQFVANMRYHPDGKVLISLRSIAGIEAVRLMIDNDSIKLNDRINKVYHHGLTKNIVKKYGIEWKDLSILFGDAGNIQFTGNLNCNNGMAGLTGYIDNKRMEIVLACDEYIVSSREIIDKEEKVLFYARFGKICEVEDYIYPEEIEFGDERIGYRLNCRIERIQLDSEQKFRFSKGKDYVIKELK